MDFFTLPPERLTVRRGNIASLLLVTGLVLSTAGCGDSDIKASKFESELIKSASLSKAEASCVTKKTYASLKQKDINKLYSAEDISDLPDDVVAKFKAYSEECASAG